MKRRAAYLRVSSASQSEGSQRDALQRAAKARGVRIDEWVTEIQSARGELARPRLEELQGRARAGELAELWVFRLDRLARGALHLATVVRELREHGCRVVSVAEGIDTSGPWADGIMALLGMFGEMELAANRERMAAARKGLKWGRPKSIGSADLKALRRLVARGWTIRSAAEKLGLAYSTAQRAISRRRGARAARSLAETPGHE